MGGGTEFRHWISGRRAVGLLYTQNPSDGKLRWQGQSYIWPQQRWDLSVLGTQRFNLGRSAPFLSIGPGVVITNGDKTSGWSAGFAFAGGFGSDYPIGRRFSTRTGITFLETKSGCYDDPTCHEAWAVVEDIRLGIVYKFGMEKMPRLTR